MASAIDIGVNLLQGDNFDETGYIKDQDNNYGPGIPSTGSILSIAVPLTTSL